MISRIGHSRGRPVAQGFGRCGTITRHSASLRSVCYRVIGRLCWHRVLGVHMANPSWFKKLLGIMACANDLTRLTTAEGKLFLPFLKSTQRKSRAARQSAYVDISVVIALAVRAHEAQTNIWREI